MERQPELEMPRKSSLKTPKLYALRIASQPGIYHSWAYAKTLIEGCPGAKYKGFLTVEECMKFIWEQFPSSTFTMNEQGDHIMDDPEPVFQVVEEARQKKEKNSGLLLQNDLSSFDPMEPNAAELTKLFVQKKAAVELNPEQQSAFELCKAGKNVFVSGGRKTGKEVLLSHIYAHLAQERKNFHITSASVITSLNSSVTFTLGWTGMGKALGTKKQILSKVRKNTQARKAWNDTSVLIIKECSMLSAFLLDVIDYLGKEIRREPTLPFGGMQVILIGDTHGHLPPPSPAISCPSCGLTHRVVPGISTSASQVGSFITCSNDECRHMFMNSWILYPFEAACWDGAGFYYVPLTRGYESDRGLQALLSGLRATKPTAEVFQMVRELASKPRGEFTIVCSTNEEMTKLNEDSFDSIPADGIRYEAIETVLNNFDFSSRAQQKEGPTDEILSVKRGLSVLVISEDGRHLDNGVVVDFGTPTAQEIEQFVKSYGSSIPQMENSLREWYGKNALLPKVKFSSGKVEIVPCRLWTVRCNGRAAAWRVQLPIRHATAISLAKGQELLLDNILISGLRDWSPGEMYMALSLGKTKNSIFLDQVNDSSFVADPRVLSFVFSAIPGEISKGVKTNNIPEGFFTNTNLNSMKRHSVAAIGGVGHKKRRPSKTPAPLPSFAEEGGEQNSSPLIDTQMLRYQQITQQQRRHSYQPLSTYQEQQYAWLNSQSNHLRPQFRQMPVPHNLSSLAEFQLPGKPDGFTRGSLSMESLAQLPLSKSAELMYPHLGVPGYVQPPNDHLRMVMPNLEIQNGMHSNVPIPNINSFDDGNWQWQNPQ